MQRAGRRAISMARHDLLALYRPHIRSILFGSAVYWIGVVGFCVVMGRVAPVLAAFAAGAMVASFFWMVAYFGRANDPFASRRMGGEAERWTSATLRTLGGAGWLVFDAVEFDGFDVDHVLVGPGGVYAVETKWASVPVGLGPTGTVEVYGGDAAAQARRGARSIRLLLKSGGIESAAHPVVVLWGRGAPRLPDGHTIASNERGPTLVLEGRRLDQALVELRLDDIDVDEVGTIGHVLENFIAVRDTRLATHGRR